MSGVSSRLSRGFRFATFGLAVIFTVIAASDADARSRRKKVRQGGGYTPPYASIVVDANSGKVLEETNADSQRHPASLTKIMTLYLLFERLEAGKIKLDTAMPVSAHAAAQSPTKLGLRVGGTIEVENAIRGLVTKSANDAAAVVAEALAGSEGEFAAMMTRKARALGMNKTTYRNASGLPDSEQVTTARDQALLGRAIQDRFPKYYRYFATHQFTYRGSTMRNHNRLLGRVEGVDGIKTGYTHSSGFNLVTSVKRGNRYIVAVVLGGRSAGARDARMRELIEGKIVTASTKRIAPMVAEANAPARMAAAQPARPITLASASPTPPAPVAVQTAPAEPIKPIAVKTVKVKFNFKTASLVTPAAAQAADEAISTQSVTPVAQAITPAAKAEPAKRAAKAEPAKPAPAAKAEPAKPARHGWIIQVGAFDGEKEAKQRLNAAQSKAKNLLSRADPFTETVTKGAKTLYRARFAGLEKDRAEAACKQLKRNDIACMTIKN